MCKLIKFNYTIFKQKNLFRANILKTSLVNKFNEGKRGIIGSLFEIVFDFEMREVYMKHLISRLPKKPIPV